VYSNAAVCEEEANARLLANGVPEHVLLSAQEVEGFDKAPVRLQGPVSGAPDVGKTEEAGDE
jgi:hypothetical protein